MIQNDAEDTANSVPVTSMVSPGLDPKDPAAIEAMNNALKLRGRDVLRAGVMGAAAGSQVGQQAGDPRSAFIQGMAAGMGATDTVFRERKQELQTAADMVPFGSTHPEIVNSNPAYAIFKGLPTKLALQAIQQIGIDAAKIQNESNARMEQGKQDFQYAVGMKSFEASLRGKDPAKYEDISAMAKDFRTLEPVAQYQIAKASNEMIKQAPDDAAGDLMIMANFAKILNPQTRFSEGNLDATDISSKLDAYTRGIYDKVISGKKLQQDERIKIKAAALKAFNVRKQEYSNVANVWEEKAAELGIDPDFVVTDKGWETKYIDGKAVMARPLGNGKWEVKP